MYKNHSLGIFSFSIKIEIRVTVGPHPGNPQSVYVENGNKSPIREVKLEYINLELRFYVRFLGMLLALNLVDAVIRKA